MVFRSGRRYDALRPIGRRCVRDVFAASETPHGASLSRNLQREGRLTRCFSYGLRSRYKLESQGLCAFGEAIDHPLLVALLVLLLAGVHVGLSTGKHEVHQPRQLVGGGSNSFGPVHSGAQPTVVGAQGRLALPQRLSGHAKGLGGAVGASLGLPREGFAARDLGAWAQTQPGGEVLDGGEST